jgi:hypothetical protein
MNTDCRVAQLYADFSFPSAREMAWPISLAAFLISAFAFPLSGAHSPSLNSGFHHELF